MKTSMQRDRKPGPGRKNKTGQDKKCYDQEEEESSHDSFYNYNF